MAFRKIKITIRGSDEDHGDLSKDEWVRAKLENIRELIDTEIGLRGGKEVIKNKKKTNLRRTSS